MPDVNDRHPGVPTEWHTVQYLSQFNVVVDADACCVGAMANAALFQHYRLPERLVQNAPPTREQLIARGFLDSAGRVARRSYYAFYGGDYDSAAWVYNMLPELWNDPARGSVPIGWAVDGELSMRFPIIYPYLYATRTPADAFIAGDSGEGGYVNPTGMLAPRPLSGLPDAGRLWRAWNAPLYRQFGIRFTGFIINGDSGPTTDAALDMYTSISADGIVLLDPVVPHLYRGVPIFSHTSDLPDDPPAAVRTMLSFVNTSQTQFLVFRSILKSAGWHAGVASGASQQAPALQVVDPLTLAYLARHALGGNNDNRVQYISDSMPRAPKAGTIVSFDVAVRNDGWNELRGTAVHLAYSLGAQHGNCSAPAHFTLRPGTTGTISCSHVAVPPARGPIRLQYGLVVSTTGQSFASFGSPDWVADLRVE